MYTNVHYVCTQLVYLLKTSLNCSRVSAYYYFLIFVIVNERFEIDLSCHLILLNENEQAEFAVISLIINVIILIITL